MANEITLSAQTFANQAFEPNEKLADFAKQNQGTSLQASLSEDGDVKLKYVKDGDQTDFRARFTPKPDMEKGPELENHDLAAMHAQALMIHRLEQEGHDIDDVLMAMWAAAEGAEADPGDGSFQFGAFADTALTEIDKASKLDQNDQVDFVMRHVSEQAMKQALPDEIDLREDDDEDALAQMPDNGLAERYRKKVVAPFIEKSSAFEAERMAAQSAPQQQAALEPQQPAQNGDAYDPSQPVMTVKIRTAGNDQNAVEHHFTVADIKEMKEQVLLFLDAKGLVVDAADGADSGKKTREGWLDAMENGLRDKAGMRHLLATLDDLNNQKIENIDRQQIRQNADLALYRMVMVRETGTDPFEKS
ncbi:MAG: hypothetical protein AAF416_11355 [Pseudomonadota bacterium]